MKRERERDGCEPIEQVTIKNPLFHRVRHGSAYCLHRKPRPRIDNKNRKRTWGQ